MSDRESFDALRENAADHGLAAFTRWPGLLSLSLGVLLGPVIALVNQELIYAANMWTCGHGYRATMHLIPLLCLVVTIGTGITAFRDWRASGGGVEEEEATVASRTRFLAIAGIGISIFSSLVVIAQWAAILVFGPCMRA
ncbi:MAG TPA: hypothetical protein VLN49_20670 [Gemmatimonadaceae bacterium]|nr:hypothetical protein [Gemmatimonadaceae bacterium]